MCNWLRRVWTWWRGSNVGPPIKPEDVDDPDPAVREIIARGWNSGRDSFSGWIDDAGNVHYTEPTDD